MWMRAIYAFAAFVTVQEPNAVVALRIRIFAAIDKENVFGWEMKLRDAQKQAPVPKALEPLIGGTTDEGRSLA